MTIPEHLAQWLQGSELLPAAAVTLDALDSRAPSCGLLFSSSRCTPLMDGSREYACRFLLVLRLATQTEALRRGARSLIERIAAWVRHTDALGDLPQLSGARICLNVSTAGTATVRDRTDAQTVYQLPLEIAYWEG